MTARCLTITVSSVTVDSWALPLWVTLVETTESSGHGSIRVWIVGVNLLMGNGLSETTLRQAHLHFRQPNMAPRRLLRHIHSTASGEGIVLVCGDANCLGPRDHGYVWSVMINDVKRNNGDTRLVVDTTQLWYGSSFTSACNWSTKGRRGWWVFWDPNHYSSSVASISGFFLVSFADPATQTIFREMLQQRNWKRHLRHFQPYGGFLYLWRRWNSSSCSTSAYGACAFWYRWHVTFTQHVGDCQSWMWKLLRSWTMPPHF